MNYLLELDDRILLALNGLHTPFLDSIMWAVSGRSIWIPLYVLLAYLLYRQEGGRRTLVWLVGIAAVILISDQTCIHSGLRQLVARPRPCNLVDNPIAPLVHVVRNYRSGQYGFPSAHAANTAALVCYLHLILRRNRLTLAMAFWCVLVCYSRMYLGVHYLGDLIGGAVIGSLSAIFVYWILKKFILPRLQGKE